MPEPSLSFEAVLARIRSDRQRGELLPASTYLAHLGEDQALERMVVMDLLEASAVSAAGSPDRTEVANPQSDVTVALISDHESTGAGPQIAPERALVISGYEVLRELGRGGMGIVYLARDPNLKREVALKVLAPHFGEEASARIRFRREAEVLSRVDHPNICGVLGVGEHEGMPWLAMRFISGRSLAEEMNAVTEARTLDGGGGGGSGDSSRGDWEPDLVMVETVARAVHAAHEEGVIHRDLKPGNIMIAPDGTPVVLDFGLANDLRPDAADLTMSGDIVGTPHYMSPEQIRGESHRADRTLDVWSLGVILYELLVGERPFKAATRDALFHLIVERDPVPIRRLNRNLPRDLEVVVATALEKEPRRRYQSAADMADDLRRVRLIKPILARRPSLPARLVKFARRQPAVALLILVLAVGGPTLAAVITSQIMARDQVRSIIARTMARVDVALSERKPRQSRELLASIADLDADAGEIARATAAARRLEMVERIETLALDTETDPDAVLVLKEIADLKATGVASSRLLTLEIFALLRAGRRDEALERAQAADDPVHGSWVVVAMQGVEEAREEITSGGEADRDLIRALVQSAAGRHRQALAILARILERYPEAHGIAWAAAEEAVHVQSLDAALAYAGRARSLAAGFGPRRQARHASHLRRAGLLEEAVVLARGAFSESPDDPIICLHLANVLAARGEREEAASLFEGLVKRQPRFSEALRGHGALLSDLKLWDRAAEMYLRALDIRKADADTWLNLGNARLSQGRPVEAEQALRQALKLRSDFPFARNSLATALRSQGKLEDARKEADALLSLSPGYAEGHSTLGSILHRMGNLEEAERAYRRALEYKPDLLQANFNLALVLGEGHPDQAIDLYRRVLKVSPNDVEALTNLSSLLADKLLFDEALSLAEKACALAPDDATSWNNLATTRLEAGQKAGAVLALRRAVSADPSRIEPHHNLMVVLREEDPLEALAHGLEFVRLNPSAALKILSDLDATFGMARISKPRHPLILAVTEGRAHEPVSADTLNVLVTAWADLPAGDPGSRLHALKSACQHLLIQIARSRGHTAALERLERSLKTP